MCQNPYNAGGSPTLELHSSGMVTKHFILRQYRIASASQPLASRRSASMKFWKSFAILAVAAQQLCETYRKRARMFKALFCIVLPSFTSNDTPSRSMASVPGFRHFRTRPCRSKFSSFSCFFGRLTSHYSIISLRVAFSMEKGLHFPTGSAVQ